MDNKKVQKKKKKKPQNKAPFMKTKKKTPEHYWKKSAPHHVEKAIPEQSGLTENAALEKASIKAESPVADPIIQEEAHKAQIPAADPVSALAKGEKKPSESKKKEKAPRTYEEICADLSDADTKNVSSIDRYVSLFLELVSLKNLTSDQIQFFFASVNELIEDAWSPFLAKVSTHVSPVKQGNERLVALELIKCCHDVLESCGLSVDDIEQACRSFCESKDSACVTDFLKRAEMVTPLESADGTLGVHKITPQELACVTFICFNYRFREFSPSSLEPLVRIDRAIAEHFSKPSLKDYAGKTFVCHLLFSNTPYPKGAAIASPKAESYQIVKSFIIERAYSLLSSFCSYISSPSDVGRVVQMLGAEKFLFFVYCDAIFEYLHRV